MEDSVQHFYDKLLLLKDGLNTDTAKEMAEKRHAYLTGFLKAYYAIVYEKAGRYEMLYAKPQFYDPVAQDYIRMYRFTDAKAVEDHPVKDGKIIMGIKQLSDEFGNEIKAIVSCFPTVKKAKEDSFTLDGYFQVIRIYKSNTVYRELFFRDVEDLVFPDKKDEISELLDGLYIQVGKIIE